MKKWLSLLLSFCLLFSSTAPMAGGIVAPSSSELEDMFEAAFQEASAAQSPETEYATTSSQVEVFIHYQQAELFARLHSYPQDARYIMNRVLKNCQKNAFAASKNKDLWEGEIEVYKWKANAGQYLQSCLDLTLQKGWNGNSVIGDAQNKIYDEGQNRLVVNTILDVGASEKGVDRAYRYLKGLLSIENLCNKADTDMVRQPQQFQCGLAAEALEGLAVLGMQHPSYKKRAAADIYQFMVNKNRSKMGQGAIYQGALLLLALNEQEKLKSFLSSEAQPTGFDSVLDKISYFSFEGIARIVHENRSFTQGEYLDSYTGKYTYLDTDLGDKWFGRGTCANRENAISSVKNMFQCPYGNLLEDLGMAIAQDSANAQTGALAGWIWSNRASLPVPLIMGLLTGADGKWTYEKGGTEAKKLLFGILSIDFSDLNEGSQRRLKIAAAESLKKRGENVSLSDYTVRDQAKFDRYARQQRERNVFGFIDLAVAVILLPRLVVSLGTLGAKGLAAFGKIRHIRKIETMASKMTRVLRRIHPASSVRVASSAGKTASSATTARTASAGAKATSAATPVVNTSLKPVTFSAPQITATGEAAVRVGLTEEKAAASIAKMQQQVKGFSLADKQTFLSKYRFNLANQYQIARQLGRPLTMAQREEAYYLAFQNVFQAQREAMHLAQLDELALAYTSTAAKTNRVIRHIPWSVRFQVGLSMLWDNLRIGLKGSLTTPQGFAGLSAMTGVGNPAFTITATTPVAASRTTAPLVMIADYAGGMGSKFNTLRTFTVPGLNAPRTLGMAQVSVPMSSKSLLSPFSSGSYFSLQQLGPRLLFPAGVSAFKGQFDDQVVAAAYQKDPVAADDLFAVRGQEGVLVSEPRPEPSILNVDMFQENLVRLLNKGGLVLGANGFVAQFVERANNLQISQEITDMVLDAYWQALLAVGNSDLELLENKFKEEVVSQMLKSSKFAQYQVQVFTALGWPVTPLKKPTAPSQPEEPEEQRVLRRQMEDNGVQRQDLIDKWQLADRSIEQILADEQLLAAAAEDLATYYRLEKDFSDGKQRFMKEFHMLYMPKAYPEEEAALSNNTPKRRIVHKVSNKESSIFADAYKGKIIEAFHDLLVTKIAQETNSSEKARLEENRQSVVDWHDEVVNKWVGYPDNHALSPAPALRKFLRKFEGLESAFSEMQMQEYEQLKTDLYAKISFDPYEAILLQNRLLMFSKWEAPTPNTIFVVGHDFVPSNVWDRKTLLGFSQPILVREAPLEEAFDHFVEGKENVLLIHGHGGVNRLNTWKAPLVWPEEQLHPEHSVSAVKIAQLLAETPSAHTSIYLNACFSGHFLNDMQEMFAQARYADLLMTTDIFVTASKNQRSMPEDLPAQWEQGDTRKKLLGKVLQRMRFNGDGLAARVMIDGKEIYPLAESVKRLQEETKGLFPNREKKKMLNALELLLQLANATSEDEVTKTVYQIEKEFFGRVMWFGNCKENGFASFAWGIDERDYQDYENFEFPFIILDEAWVNYVSGVAEELFNQVPPSNIPYSFPNSVQP
ncbi:MAG: hypothetical protein IKL48_04465 [Elusimicrobiaceae bacterium]|nr:hypothetical protein [Elusimicrobiaceae bacterium]